MKKFLLFSVLIVVIIGVTFSCVKRVKNDNKVVIRVAYWGGPEEIKIITDLMKQWEATHTNIIVKLQHTKGGSDYISKILTQMAGDSAPDIVFTEVNVFVPMYEKNIFLDLTPFIKKDKEFNINDFFQPVVKRFTRNGEIYVIPRDIAPFACVYYNKQLFDEAGVAYPTDNWNFNDLLRIAKKLTKRDANGNIIQYGFYSWSWMNFVYSFGGKITDSVEHPAKCMLGSPASLRGLQFYMDLCNKYKVSPSPLALKSLDQGPAEMFMAGKLAMMTSGIWETPRFRKIKSFDWDIVMFPKGPVKRAFGSGGSGYAITKATKHPEEAWEVLKALAGVKGQEWLAKTGLAQPANRIVAEGKYFAKSKEKPLNKKMLNKAVNYIIFEPFHSKWQEAQDKYLRESLDMLFSNELSIDEFKNKVVKNIDNLMFGEKK